MGRKLALAHKQKYPADSKAVQLHEGRFIKVRTKVEPRSYGQEFYMNCLNECNVTLATGPAGCGKTWLVTHFALTKLLNNEVQKIVVTKPILEAAGESLGYLPGSQEEKILPHFLSILDCIEDHLGPTMTKQLLEREKIVFLPVAYARGRDIKNAFILIDEAQNLTRSGIKTMMSRMSENSFMALNGDSDQCDLKNPKDSGLDWAVNCLRGKDPQIGVVEMNDEDIQRHPLLKTILRNLR
jgi:phosphate starvation-inducible PhoH-like protein